MHLAGRRAGARHRQRAQLPLGGHAQAGEGQGGPWPRLPSATGVCVPQVPRPRCAPPPAPCHSRDTFMQTIHEMTSYTMTYDTTLPPCCAPAYRYSDVTAYLTCLTMNSCCLVSTQGTGSRTAPARRRRSAPSAGCSACRWPTSRCCRRRRRTHMSFGSAVCVVTAPSYLPTTDH